MEKLVPGKKKSVQLSWRVTRIRTALLNVLRVAAKPLTAKEIYAGLAKAGRRADRVTVYRDLALFLRHGAISDIEFGDGKKRYELTAKGHHHHVICTTCKRVEDIALTHDVEEEGARLGRQKGFEIAGHSLEFFGLCKNCRLVKFNAKSPGEPRPVAGAGR